MTKDEADSIVRLAVKNIVFLANKEQSIGEVERKADLSPGYLSRVIHFKKGISFRNVLMLADAVDAKLSDIMNVDFMKQKRIDELEKELKELRGY